MSKSFDLTIVIAQEGAAGNLSDILRVTQPDTHPQVEYIVCSTSSSHLDRNLQRYDNVRLLSDRGRIPLLWKAGILAANSDKVALTTAHCVPDPGWIDRLLHIEIDANVVGVGGAIANSKNAGTLSWAIYLLRYFSFRPERSAGKVQEIAADNAVYSRAAIMGEADLLEIGFWEPSFHKRFIKDGLELWFDPDLLVYHENQYTLWQFARQRFDHGTAFGSSRADSMGLPHLLLMIFLSPLIPLVFSAKIVRAIQRDSRYHLHAAKSSPLLFFFVCAWSLGEVRGYLGSLWHKSEP